MITQEEFQRKYNISDELFQSAGITWEELCYIYKDFLEKKNVKYTPIMRDFVETYLSSGFDKQGIHSIRYRVKDAEHLMAKIIRRKQDNAKKYRSLTKDNYEKFLTDLIGIRCFILFKSDWKKVHLYLLANFENNEKYYIKNPITDFDENEDHIYLAEAPKVHIRNGDDRTIYEELLPTANVIDDKIYRSAHYIIKYRGIYLEIQVRTLFEEGWGEVDHAVVYPYFQNDPLLKEYTGLLNRVSGLADEMGSFFTKIRDMMPDKGGQICQDKKGEQDSKQAENDCIDTTKEAAENSKKVMTPESCLQFVLNE